MAQLAVGKLRLTAAIRFGPLLEIAVGLRAIVLELLKAFGSAYVFPGVQHLPGFHVLFPILRKETVSHRVSNGIDLPYCLSH